MNIEVTPSVVNLLVSLLKSLQKYPLSYLAVLVYANHIPLSVKYQLSTLPLALDNISLKFSVLFRMKEGSSYYFGRFYLET